MDHQQPRKSHRCGDFCVRGRGLLQAVEFVADPGWHEATVPRHWPAGAALVLDRGSPRRSDPHWIAFDPPLTSSTEGIGAMA